MEFRSAILVHFLLISLALNVGTLFRNYCNPNLFFPKSSNKNHSFSIQTCNASTSLSSSSNVFDRILHLDYGDPTMFEKYWQNVADKTTLTIPGSQSMSYFSDSRDFYWFLEPEFEKSVIRLHKLVGNAITDNRYLVVGTGSTQLFQAALYAIASPESLTPVDVVAAAPFYSGYPATADFVKSGLHKWAGDATSYTNDQTKYIEVITSPNNPDGFLREAVVKPKNCRRTLVHDLAYYWPQYTPITSPADHDIMLFTVSKCTGHAGTRIGWAIVKDRTIASKMVEFVTISTIGVSKESQLRAKLILDAVASSHEQVSAAPPFFEHSYELMAARWKQLRDVIQNSKLFKLPDYLPQKCKFSGHTFAPQPAFAWLKCEGEIDDCKAFLESHKILTRGGNNFGVSNKYTRMGMISRDQEFCLLRERLYQIG
ncbi:tryptophan aminotransferase-related protein 2-like [Andrographis paniculata]|uniref:tryptophan aminotransferase-related protein 2-like n=1 Tax=Andrographis paniculata TaxID=175694 RepID=UPI0021E99D4F|nr:tryptophan aminotransferase-related protein 2-like [Andrographis paniculata]